MYAKLLFRLALIIGLIAGPVHASAQTVYRLMVTAPPGSVSDVATRAVQHQFNLNNQGRATLMIENVPGADGIVGINRYKNGGYDAVMTASSYNVFNYVFRKDVPYTEKDFNHIIYLGTLPGVWITAASNTSLISPDDLIKNYPAFVGHYATSWGLNDVIIRKEKKLSTTIVPYKGSPDLLIAVANRTVPVGIIALSPSVSSMAKDGKIRIIGGSNGTTQDFVYDDILIRSIHKDTGIPQIAGFLGLALSPNISNERSTFLKSELWKATQHPETRAKLQRASLWPDATNDMQFINKRMSTLNELAKKYGSE
jgi:tripartite-type tricarboxylate transporter receptor subunit TctC